MNEMNIPYENPYMDINEMNIQYGNQYKDMSEKKQNPCPKMVLAMAYVPDQSWETPYEISEGFHRGTLFPGLDKPFLGGGNRL